MQKLCCVRTRQQFSASLDHLSPAYLTISPSILNHFWWELYNEDGDKDLVEYGDQGVGTEEHDKATYGELMKTQSKEEEEVKYNMALCTNNSMSLEKKRR